MSIYPYLFLILSKVFCFPAFSMQVVPAVRLILKSELEKGPLIDKGPEQTGKGSFGDVHNGIYRGSVVAIKVFHLKSLPPPLASELEDYQKMSYPHLVGFYGICDQPGNFSMVMELMSYSLRKFYSENQLSWENIFNFGEQIARGLSYLHSKNIAHKHLKSNNVFLADDLTIKISDFGLSKIKLESSSNGAAGAGEATVRWRAPETFTREYSKVKDTLEAQRAADIYSYGLLLWEMRTRKKPFATHTETSVVQLLSVATREEIDTKWPTHFKTLLNDAWRFVPSERPTVDKILETLQKEEFNIKAARAAPVEGYTKGNQMPTNQSEIDELKAERQILKNKLEIAEKENKINKTKLQSDKQDSRNAEGELKAEMQILKGKLEIAEKENEIYKTKLQSDKQDIKKAEGDLNPSNDSKEASDVPQSPERYAALLQLQVDSLKVDNTRLEKQLIAKNSSIELFQLIRAEHLRIIDALKLENAQLKSEILCHIDDDQKMKCEVNEYSAQNIDELP